MKNTIKIQETAFVTATFRASNVALSKDKYSHYWTNPKTDKWIENFTQKVSVHESFTHCLRNRYFFETLQRLIDNKEIEVLINFGCGFSMYPFLLEGDVTHIEIDQKEIVEYKKSEVQKLIQAGSLPERKIHYIAKDFNLEKEALELELKSIVKDRPSFTLIEGVIFFLNKTTTDELIELTSRVQSAGDYLGAVSYLESITETTPFKKLISFFEEKISGNSKFEYLNLPTSYYKSFSSYHLIEHEDYVSLSKRYSPKDAIEDGNTILNENMYLLRRQ